MSDEIQRPEDLDTRTWVGEILHRAKLCERCGSALGAPLRGCTNRKHNEVAAAGPFHDQPAPDPPAEHRPAEKMLKRKLWERNGTLDLDSGDSIRWVSPKPGVGALLEVRGPDSATAAHLTPAEVAMLVQGLKP